MNIIFGTPSGNRLQSIISVIEAWKKYNIKTAVISWDDKTLANIDCYYKTKIDKMFSWGVCQNLLVSKLPSNWDAYLALCDDHFPAKNIDLIAKAVEKYPDCVISPNDGHLARCFMFITRGWYEKHPVLFDEHYIHNCVDYDICQQASAENKYINCPQIVLEHKDIVPEGYVNIAHLPENHAIDMVYYKSKWPDKPHQAAFSVVDFNL